MADGDGAFWRDLGESLEDPEFRDAFVRESQRIALIDGFINELDDARVALGMTKADLARAIDMEPAAIRRLLTAKGNPTLKTVTDVASALGMKITLTPLTEDAPTAPNVDTGETEEPLFLRLPKRTPQSPYVWNFPSAKLIFKADPSALHVRRGKGRRRRVDSGAEDHVTT